MTNRPMSMVPLTAPTTSSRHPAKAMHRILPRQVIGDAGHQQHERNAVAALGETGRLLLHRNDLDLETQNIGQHPGQHRQGEVAQEKPQMQKLAVALEHWSTLPGRLGVLAHLRRRGQGGTVRRLRFSAKPQAASNLSRQPLRLRDHLAQKLQAQLPEARIGHVDAELAPAARAARPSRPTASNSRYFGTNASPSC